MTQTHDTIRKDSELGPIPQEWEESNIGEFGGLLPGYAFKSDDFGDTGIPIIKIKNISETGSVDLENTDKVQDHVLNEKTSKFLLSNGDFIVAMTGATIGKVGKIKSKGERILLNQRVGKFEIKDQSKLDKDFLYYNTQNKPFLDVINNIANGVAQANISGAQIELISIPLPPLHEQQAIASLLGSLDDKIEVLREQNRTLEKMGQTMFYEWFGKYSIEDELPEGWRVGKLGDIIQLLNGFPFKTESYSQVGEYKLVTIGNVNDGVFDGKCNNNILELPEKLPEYCKLQPGDVLLSLTGNVGRVCIVFGENYVLNQRVAKIVPNGGNHIGLAYFLMRSKQMQDLMISISRGTAQMNLSPVETKDLECIVPSKQDILKMETNFQDFYSKILANFEDIYNLIQLRDNLLPRLMSGKVRVF